MLISPPSLALSEFVECYWLVRRSDLTHSRELVIPSGAMELVINLEDDLLIVGDERGEEERVGRAVLAGARMRSCVIDSSQQASLIGVAFRPGGAFAFFRFPMVEIRGCHISLAEGWGGAAAELRERLCLTSSAQRQFSILDATLLEWLRDDPYARRSVASAVSELAREPSIRISDLADRVGRSERRLRESFALQVGLTPKQFGRIMRVQSALRLLSENQKEWSRIALASEYYDQAHFNNEFREITGLTPSAYVNQRVGPGNHVPISH